MDASDLLGQILGTTLTSARELGTAVASSAVVRVRTQLTPEIALEPFAPGDPRSSEPGFLLELLKPEVSVTVAGQSQVYAPYGRPTRNFFPLVLAGLGALLAAGVLGIALVARRL